ncbi:MAG: class I SAM-dependent methyltransferase [Acidimicrobiia bacterium]|nr:class I SAM-dependent methyltransferase [Acidimicrobiia bacterium]
MSAAARWRAYLEGWALPADLLAAVPDSPYVWPADLYRRRQRAEAGGPPDPTARVVAGLLPGGGSVLDVGAGTGRASLPIAAEGHRLTAVERNPAMAAVLRTEAETAGVEVRVIEGPWPEVAAEAGRHDVVVCTHVVYDIAELAPFLRGLHEAARVAVVLEAGERHPWANLIPYYRAMHHLERPDGPTAGLLVEVVGEVLRVTPEAEHWIGGDRMRFADLQELVEFYRRRLLVPVARTAELADRLVPDIVEQDGWLSLGSEQGAVTLWWRTG